MELLKNEIKDVKDVMVKNIDKLVDRGDHIALLVKKTDRMNNMSSTLRG